MVTLDSRQEAALQVVAEKFIAQHKGDAVKALKEMIVLNGHLQERLDAVEGRRRATR
ncbi:hypothetical protein ACN2CC_23575 [Mesorhizobium muleiense]|uniref:hypothetical protein n=1 Tax=Mesorhizobium muleiense TaxID=1004279 RepID=UPI003AFA9CDD